MTIRMQAIPEKRAELSQAIASMIPRIRAEEGCRRCEFCRNTSDEDEICVFGEWTTREKALAHLESELFKVILGAKALLKKPHDVRLYALSDFPKRLEGRG